MRPKSLLWSRQENRRNLKDQKVQKKIKKKKKKCHSSHLRNQEWQFLRQQKMTRKRMRFLKMTRLKLIFINQFLFTFRKLKIRTLQMPVIQQEHHTTVSVYRLTLIRKWIRKHATWSCRSLKKMKCVFQGHRRLENRARAFLCRLVFM